jgi:hypothetical protein
MSCPLNELYSHEPNKGELVSKMLVYEVKHITRKGRMCVLMIAVSQPGCMEAKVQCNTPVHDK